MAGPGVEAAVGDRAFGALVKRNAETGLIEPRGDLAAVDEDLVATVAHDIARHAQHPLAEELRAFPEMHFDELARRLARSVPAQQRSTIAHGDFRTDNVVYDAGDPRRINAVLDWELSTLGDPLTDVGLLMLFWRSADESQLSLIPGITHLPGFPERDVMLERYAAASGADLSDMGFYRAFAHFKFAVIAQGVQARAAAGAMGGQDFGNLDDEILELAQVGLQHI